ncbi:hypothetical protein BDF19DRAFT_475559 [Syncephalis fuscata]|nr:hypothetical protein BDF19DRAFT_475559 [Syncephalis fuscata]
MFFKINTLILAATGALLLVSTAHTATAGPGLFGFSKAPVEHFYGQSKKAKALFNQSDIKLEHVISQDSDIGYAEVLYKKEKALLTCVTTNPATASQDLKIIHVVYQSFKYESRFMDSKAARGKQYVAHAVHDFPIHNMHCYVSMSRCAMNYYEFGQKIKDKIDEEELAFKAAKQFISALRYLKAKGWMYNFYDETVCVDVKGNILLPYFYKTEAIPSLDKSIQNLKIL